MYGASVDLVLPPRSVLTDALLKDGSVALTADWDAGAFEIRAQTFESDVATGTAPFVVASTTVSTNLNADLLDGLHASSFALASSVDNLQSVRAATTTNITLSGEQTIDGVSCVAGDRVLVKIQTVGSEEGIYVVSAGAWSRATDMAAASSASHKFVFVQSGTINAQRGYLCNSAPGSDVVGTNNLSWAVFSAFNSVGSIILPAGATGYGFEAVDSLIQAGGADTIVITAASGGGNVQIGDKGTQFLNGALQYNTLNQVASGLSTLALDFTESNVLHLTLTGSVTTLSITAPRLSTLNSSSAPAILELIVEQGTGGSHTIDWTGGNIRWPGGTAPTLSTALGKRDWIRLLYTGSGTYYGQYELDMSP